MISLFPGEQQDEVRSQVSQVLRAVICQRLLRWETSFITIRDILLNTNAVANLIRNRKEPQIVSIQETQSPMKTLEMAVRDAKTQYGSAQQLHALLEQQLS
jgi:twitching motility protein